MKKHEGSCNCGDVTVECAGKPVYIGMCHCENCQKRTGSAFGLTAWFEKSQIQVHGSLKTYETIEHGGIETKYNFCPNCGTTIGFEIARNSSGMGISVGCFTNPEFPKPTVSFYEKDRHPWVRVPDDINRVIAEGGSKKV